MTMKLSKSAIAAIILSITMSFSVVAEGWMQPMAISPTRRTIKNSAQYSRSTTTATTRSTQLSLFKYIEPDPSTPPPIQLTPEQDQALRSAAAPMEETYGISWFEESSPWDELKTQYPSLQEYSNDELRRAYVMQKPTVVDLFVKTPLGPFLLLNLVFFLSGFSWCNTPFHVKGGCLP